MCMQHTPYTHVNHVREGRERSKGVISTGLTRSLLEMTGLGREGLAAL